ncbi:MAG: hypothetical protein AMXMBFR36_16720 [Acidobacteriota bacterium]
MPAVERGPHPGRRRWTAAEVALLGAMPDAAVAGRLRINPRTVIEERQRRGIRAFRPRRPDTRWTARMIALLGQDTDRAVAAELGLSEGVVQRKRDLLGIPRFTASASGGEKRARPWTRREIALIGSMSDAALAERLRISVTAVVRKRRSLGIASFRPARRPIRWTKRSIRLQGSLPDRVVAERLGVSAATVRAKRLALGIRSTLGDRARAVVRKRELREIARLPVVEACRRFDLSNTTVAKIRAELGLAVRRWTAEDDRLLGTAPDRDVARRLRRSLDAVRSRRYKLGIPVANDSAPAFP